MKVESLEEAPGRIPDDHALDEMSFRIPDPPKRETPALPTETPVAKNSIDAAAFLAGLTPCCATQGASRNETPAPSRRDSIGNSDGTSLIFTLKAPP